MELFIKEHEGPAHETQVPLCDFLPGFSKKVFQNRIKIRRYETKRHVIKKLQKTEGIRMEETQNKLTRKEFDILEALIGADGTVSQRMLGESCGLSAATVNRLLKELSEKNLVRDGGITGAGRACMEQYRVKKAVFIAAGFGSRLVPVTLNTPKPLVRVNGVRMIDGLIDAVLALGIEDIVIVRGYLAGQFDELLKKYPMLRFVDNPDYNEANNIASALAVREELGNAYVFEADLLLKNPKILKKYHYSSDFLAFYTDRTDDWCFEVENGIIRTEKFGGLSCYQMVGISYWNEEDGKKLAAHLPMAYALPGGRERYWEQVPLSVYAGDYEVSICECAPGDVIEIDTFRELKAIDPAYGVQ